MSDLITINTNGLEEAIRCAICENPIKSKRGCDGGCKYDEKSLKSILQAIKDNEVKRPHGKWILVKPYTFACSLCGRLEEHQEPFCNCGAKMEMRVGEAE